VNRSAVLALAAAALFGASAPLAKLLLAEIEPLPLAALLYLGSGLGAVVFLALRRASPAVGTPRFEAHPTRADLPWLAGAILAGGVAAPILLLSGLAITPAGTVSLLLNFEVVATTLLAAVAFREPIGRRVWTAVLLIAAAGVLLALRSADGVRLSRGALAVIAACALWGLDNNLTRKVSAKNPMVIVAAKGLVAGVFLLGLSLGLRSSLPTAGIAVEAMALGCVSYGISLALFVRALRELGAARAGAWFSTAPFIGSALSFLVFRELPTPLFILSGALMAAGAFLLLSERHAHRHDHPALVHDHRHRHDDGHHDHVHAPGEIPPSGWHSHPHRHTPRTHAHPHAPDLHHDHGH
jgi:drug/metabolite transporter (DMT)-like permease